MKLPDLFTPEQFAEVLRGAGRMALTPDSAEAQSWSAELEEYFKIVRALGLFRGLNDVAIAYMVTLFRATDAAVRYATEEQTQ